jgi:hypothetical protein
VAPHCCLAAAGGFCLDLDPLAYHHQQQQEQQGVGGQGRHP